MPDRLDRTVVAEALVRLIAYYLPQFHPIPENDLWWGRGFTEWTNVAKARPLFRGHQQPRLPADLGFYDLRVPETREAQAALARASGIEGFCYWHYWFGSGRRLLERPFREVLQSGEPDFPFCLAWANQTWSGIWHGDPKRVLIRQEYPGPDDEKAHFDALLPAFMDRRYIRIDGRPLFSVYAPLDLPDPPRFIAHWRRLAEGAGLPGLYVVAIHNNEAEPRLDAFDAVTPNAPGDFLMSDRRLMARAARRVKHSAFGHWWGGLYSARLGVVRREPYRDLVRHGLARDFANDRFLPCVIPNWDNSPRSGRRGNVIEGATPDLLGRYLSGVAERVRDRPANRRLVFLKAWNEWAEGNYVEPDRMHGMAYLEAIRDNLLGRSADASQPVRPAAVSSQRSSAA